MIPGIQKKKLTSLMITLLSYLLFISKINSTLLGSAEMTSTEKINCGSNPSNKGGATFPNGPAFCVQEKEFIITDGSKLERKGQISEKVTCSKKINYCAELRTTAVNIYTSTGSSMKHLGEFVTTNPDNKNEYLAFASASWIDGTNQLAVGYNYGITLFDVTDRTEYRFFNDTQHASKTYYHPCFLQDTNRLVFKGSGADKVHFLDLTAWKIISSFEGDVEPFNGINQFLTPDLRRDKYLVYLTSAKLKIIDMTLDNKILSSSLSQGVYGGMEAYPESDFFLISWLNNLEVYQLDFDGILSLKFKTNVIHEITNIFWNPKFNEMWFADSKGLFNLIITSTSFCSPSCSSCNQAFTPNYLNGCIACQSSIVPSGGGICTIDKPSPASGEISTIIFGGQLFKVTDLPVLNKSNKLNDESGFSILIVVVIIVGVFIILILIACIGAATYRGVKKDKSSTDKKKKLKRKISQVVPARVEAEIKIKPKPIPEDSMEIEALADQRNIQENSPSPTPPPQIESPQIQMSSGMRIVNVSYVQPETGNFMPHHSTSYAIAQNVIHFQQPLNDQRPRI